MPVHIINSSESVSMSSLGQQHYITEHLPVVQCGNWINSNRMNHVQQLMSALRVDIEKTAPKKVCPLCGPYEEYDFGHHKGTLQHRFNFLLFEYNKFKNEVRRDRNGITVNFATCNNVQGNPVAEKGAYYLQMTPEQFSAMNRDVQIIVEISNNQSGPVYVILNILDPYTAYDLVVANKKYLLQPGETFRPIVKFQLNLDTIGSFKIPVAITVQPKGDSRQYFTIYKSVFVYIQNAADNFVQHEESPFKKERWTDVQKFVGPTKSHHMLHNHPILVKYERIMLAELKEASWMTTNELSYTTLCKNILHSGLSRNNYVDFFEILLWMDESVARAGLMEYNMSSVPLKYIRNRFIELEVPGLAEKRPSIVQGDLVNIRIKGDHTSYQGVAEQITANTIYIEHVHPDLIDYIKAVPNDEFDINFEFSRLQHERMHQGIHSCVKHNLMDTLFPTQPHVRITPIELTEHDLINKGIINNKQQLTAVRNIVSGSSQKAPYIIFGPPGTGKTVTIVESILQLKQRFPHKSILICAPSNAACDMLTSKLIQYCKRDELLRLNSLNRQWSVIPQEIRGYCNLVDEDAIAMTSDQLKKFRIVIATLHLIGKYNQKYSPNFLFIDEAAQATEPECAIPMGLLRQGAQVVLAGDPKQLGAVCHSTVAENNGLGMSLLERLMSTNSLYKPTQNAHTSVYNPTYLTMLKLNYRSHKDIIAIPNELFYNNSLLAMEQADPITKVIVSLKVAKHDGQIMGRRGTSVEFCGVMSREDRKGSSPSFYNVMEIQTVLKYVHALLATRECSVKQTDIGIIAPYVRQVYLIKNRLSECNLNNVEVGTTESYQGREKRIMIISTVRAQHCLLQYDHKYKLGFVKQQNRFNVALTRAKSKLIIIGNPFVLGYDTECWLKYIEYCKDKMAYFGIPYEPRTDARKKEIMDRIELSKSHGIRTSFY